MVTFPEAHSSNPYERYRSKEHRTCDHFGDQWARISLALHLPGRPCTCLALHLPGLALPALDAKTSPH